MIDGFDAYGLAIGFWYAWAKRSVEDHEARVWSRLAYACRYGHIPLSEALSLGTLELLRFCKALDEIVSQENAPRKG